MLKTFSNLFYNIATPGEGYKLPREVIIKLPIKNYQNNIKINSSPKI